MKKNKAELAVEAVMVLHNQAYAPVEEWARGYSYTENHCTHDGQHWPCATVKAIQEAHK